MFVLIVLVVVLVLVIEKAGYGTHYEMGCRGQVQGRVRIPYGLHGPIISSVVFPRTSQNEKSQITSTKLFTRLNISINSVTVLIIKEHTDNLCRKSLQNDLTGQVNLKYQTPMTQTPAYWDFEFGTLGFALRPGSEWW